jgi:N-acetylglutamate synthase-like GNAT family acetyltransferase
MGLTPVRPGEIAAVVTSLEMRTRPLPRPLAPSPLQIVRWQMPAPDSYRALFRRVGSRWLWFSRLMLDDAALRAIVHDDKVQVYAVLDRNGVEVGMLELDYREPRQTEIAFLGLVPELAGKGHGRWLMSHALSLAWKADVERVWVHTCTLDHPAALGFYQAQGFQPFARAVEEFADPRLLGVLPRDAAPQIPLLAPLS